jgi:hypothetical protein
MLKIYTQDEINTKLAYRQDKWGARMDSVGYGVNASTAKETGKAAWKAAGAASLVQALTINRDMQVRLTYAGSQLPNFMSQCKDFLYYQDSSYKSTSENAFAHMITPDGSATVKGDAGTALWNQYLDVVELMYKASTNSSDKSKTVEAWMNENSASFGITDFYYDPDYKSTLMSEVSTRAVAMKILCMTRFTKADRDLSLRMQEGLNSVKDSAMYTYQDTWLLSVDARGTQYIMAYSGQKSLLNSDGTTLYDLTKIVRDVSVTPTGNQYATPQWYLLSIASNIQTLLDESIQAELDSYGGR